MTGLNVGQPWETGTFKSLRIEPWTGTDVQWAALAVVRNATLAGVDAPGYPPLDAAALRRAYDHPAFDLARDARLVWLGAEPVGAVLCYPRLRLTDRVPTNFEIFVVPGVQQHGLGARLLAHIEVAAQARGHHALTTTISQHYSAGRDFLFRHGFQPVAQHVHLTRPTLTDIRAAPLPSGFTLTSLAALGGDPDLYRITVNRLGAYDSGYELLQPEDLDYLMTGPGWQPAAIFFLHAPGDHLAGIIRASQQPDGTGYLHEIRLDPGYRGQGLATALVAAALAHLTAQGVIQAALDTDAVDTPPYRLALRCAFQETHRWVDFIKPLGGG